MATKKTEFRVLIGVLDQSQGPDEGKKKKWDSEICNNIIWMDETENFELLDCPESNEPTEAA